VHRALNRRAEDDLLTGAICVELTLADGDAPEWVHLLPLGPQIAGRDGRVWNMPDPEAVVAATAARELPAPIDYMHASEHRREDGSGTEAPAAAWITGLEVVRQGEERAPGIWGRVEWTPRGRQAVKDREYRFLSPAFLFRKSDGAAVERLTSAGLVHKPNLILTALNVRGEETAMNPDERKALCRKLGLPEDASVDAIMGRVTELDAAHKALNARGEVVPKAELETALNRAQQAEAKLKAQEETAFNARVEAILDKHQKAGKFTPASREFFKSTCATQEGLEKFDKAMEAQPAVVAPGAESMPAAEGDAGKETAALNAEDRDIAEQLGISLEDAKKFKEQALAAERAAS
jgi:phage I-like protein